MSLLYAQSLFHNVTSSFFRGLSQLLTPPLPYPNPPPHMMQAGPPKLSKPVLESMDALKWETFAAMFLAPN